MQLHFLAPCIGLLAILAITPAAHAETPAEAFRRGLEDGQKLRDRLFGGTPEAARQQQLEAQQAEVLRLYKAGELTAALEKSEPLLGAIEHAFGRKSREYSATLGIKAGILQDLGRYEAAIDTYREAANITREALGTASPFYAQDLNNLGDLLRVTGLLEESAVQLQEAARVAGQNSDTASTQMRAVALVNLGEVLRRLKRYDEAGKVLTEALDLGKKLDSLELVAAAVSNRSLVHMDQGKLAQALEKLDQLPPYLKERGTEASSLGLLIQSNRAGLMAVLGKLGEAEALARANVALAERTFPNAASVQAKMRAALGAILVKSGQFDEARPLLIDALGILVSPEQRLEDLVAPAAEEDRFVSLYIAALAQIALNTASGDAPPNDVTSLLFRLVEQFSPSASARALRQMTLRAAARNPDVAEMVRHLQDVEGQFVSARRSLFAMRGPTSTAESQRLRKAVVELQQQRAALVQKIDARWPGYSVLAGGDPATIEVTRAVLRPDEALVRIFALPQPSPLFADAYVWVLTSTTSRLVPLGLDLNQIATEVAALRCGLDAASWAGDGAKRCRTLLGLPEGVTPGDSDPLPFDTARAHALYKSLLGEAADLVKGKHLLVVPSGPLTTLPFQVLVTAPATDMASARWLIRDHALTVLPAVSSLTARLARPSRATRPMIGFGNPLLDGDQAHQKLGAEDKMLSEMARARTGCATMASQRTAARRSVARSLRPVPQLSGLADLDHLRIQRPLPETADELCQVVRAVGGRVEDVRLGATATESEVKRLSASGALAQYRMLHFATHGTLAGQLSGTNEPGLILTPPTTATAEDDGFLSGSEIASLKLDADWVILSACNTAGGAGEGEAAEALSGLARVFFYAGARALLVSHWGVDSHAAVKLVTGAIGELAKDSTIGRAEALRRATLAAMTDTTRPAGWVPAWHPSVWAPFVVVGEGGAGR